MLKKAIWKRKKNDLKKQKKSKKKQKKSKKKKRLEKNAKKGDLKKQKKKEKQKKQVKTQESNETSRQWQQETQEPMEKAQVTMERGLHTQLDPTFPEGGPTSSLTLPRDLGLGVQPPDWPYPGTWLGGSCKEAGSKKSDLGGPPLPDEGVPSSFQPPSPPSRMGQPNLQSSPQT